MYFDWEKPTDTLTLDIYPDGHNEFEMYEDDGLTREHRQGVFATTKFEVTDNRATGKGMDIVINAAKGDFKGRMKERVYVLEIHTSGVPKEVKAQGSGLKAQGKAQGAGLKAQGKIEGAEGEWKFEANDRGGVLRITTGKLSTDKDATITIL